MTCVSAKYELQEALGDNFSLYMSKLKQWFYGKLTKEEFDMESRKLLTPDKVQCHNNFLLAMFNKADSLSSVNAGKDTNDLNHSQSKDKFAKGKLKRKSKLVRTTFEQRFQAAPLCLYTPQVVAKETSDENRLPFCIQEGLLPDITMIHGRMFVTSWEYGLDIGDDKSVVLMVLAVQNFMKNIISAVLSKRSAYRLRENRFQYALGCPAVNIYLRNAQKICMYAADSHATSVSVLGEHVPNIRPTVEWAESEAALEMACDIPSRKRRAPVSAYDLFDALKVHKYIIASHSVYSRNMERISSLLHHPSHEEIEQENIYNQEEKLRALLEAEVVS